ncbi:hypothetical protein [Arenimonas alkanexedens]
MTRPLFAAAALCVLLAGCQDNSEPDADYPSAEARRSQAIQNPETGVYVPAVAGDPAGIAAPQDLDIDADPEAAATDGIQADDAGSELARVLLECNDLPLDERNECRERVGEAHAEALREQASSEPGAPAND